MRIHELNAEEIKSRYVNGESTNAIALSHGTTHHTIQRLLRHHGVALRDKRESHRATFKYFLTGETYCGKSVFKTRDGRLCIKKDYGSYCATATLIRTKCDYCGQSILSLKNNKVRNRACSDKCRWMLQSGDKNVNWSGNSKKHNGYIWIYMPKHPRSYKGRVPAHRLVMENEIGRYLTKDEVVHHINGIKDDNRIDNLCLCSKSEHSDAHNSVISLLKHLLDDNVIIFNAKKKIYERTK